MRWPSTVMLPTAADPVMDRLAALAAATLEAPRAMVLLVSDDGTQVVLALPGAVGLDEDLQRSRSLVDTDALQTWAREATATDAVDDTWTDERLRGREESAAGVRALLATPLRSVHDDLDPGAASEVSVWGLLVVMDEQPRRWSQRDRDLLEDIAAAVCAELRSRVLVGRTADAEAVRDDALSSYRAVDLRSQLLLRLAGRLADASSVKDVSDALGGVIREVMGVDYFGLMVKDRGRPVARYVDMSTFPAGTDEQWAELDLRSSLAPVARAITENRPFFFDDLAAVRRQAPELEAVWEHPGAVVIVPMRLSERVIGALVLMWEAPRVTSDPQDRASWLALADYAAQTLARVQLTAERRSAAETLQRSMLTELPEPEHLELRARYLPAASGAQVGGDWYDALVLPDGSTVLVIGDVTGHDMTAAARMGQLRTMLRTLAFVNDEPPSDVLDRLERAVAGLGVDGLATLLLARVEPGTATSGGRRTLRWSNAGHPPPVLLRADGTTEVLTRPVDLLIGLDTGRPRHDHTCTIPAGATLLLFTDGVVERRGRSIEEGLDHLQAVLRRYAGLPLAELLDAVLVDLVGDAPEDDCALLALRELA